MTSRRLYSICGAAVLSAPIVFMQFSTAGGQTPAQLTPEEVVKQTHDGFRKAKNSEEIESVKEWCRDYLATFSFKERNQLMIRALSLLQDNKIEEGCRRRSGWKLMVA